MQGKGFVVPTCTMMKKSSLKLIMDEDVGCIKTSHAFILNNMDLQNQNHVNIRSNLSCVDLHMEMKKPDAISVIITAIILQRIVQKTNNNSALWTKQYHKRFIKIPNH